ncbi:MAG: 2-oxoglutarate dehydrogenase E1 component [Paraglaciecola sp.]|jgi:2-oxoglutarate dehydrogenase E1 component
MTDFSFISNAHPSFIATLYDQYKQDPNSVEEGWRTFFKGFEFSENGNSEAAMSSNTDKSGDFNDTNIKEFSVLSIIRAFRNRGHLRSKTNPIRERRNRAPNLDLTDFGLSDADMDTVFKAGNEIRGLKDATLRQIMDRLEKVYCGSIGFEYNYIESRERRRWIREKIENHDPEEQYKLSLEKKHRILEKLNGAVGFEKFLHTKYVGQKRFSLEGGDSAIPALDAIINLGGEHGLEEVVIGMAHRGRLNVLANIMQKSYEQIFSEFEGNAVPESKMGDGDVKYHLGYSSIVETTGGKKVHLKLAPNPSHLESVGPVVEGFARAKADMLYGNDYDKILPILIHGDAAVAGQGVVFETVQMSKLPAYKTGGTIHFVINNQIGFTTDFYDARSSTYCTAAAAVVQAPVFHVNGDDPEAVIFAVEMAMEYRQKFNNDVFIDMVCFRRHGHNEGDDPNFTQPEMYTTIKNHPDVREIYGEQLLKRGDFTKEELEKIEQDFWNILQNQLDDVKNNAPEYKYQQPEEAWRALRKETTDKDFDTSPETGIDAATRKQIVDHLMKLPSDFNIVSKIKRVLKGKQKLLDVNQLDWAMAELMAYGSLLLEGHDVRMTGQDVRRGTFSHRHAVLTDDGTTKVYNRLDSIAEKQGQFRIFNSLLSEFAVMGFEYGYAMASPDNLVIWEGQFGDFYNGAQTIVDQYITAAESKWSRMNGLVLLLPHGYAGQGPEHSSGRVERFLQSCAQNNMTVANCTTPANFFHLMRRQLARPFRKPLIVMTPKSLLRHAEVVSEYAEFETGTRFQEVLDDATVGQRSNKKVTRVLFCTGKIYYDLAARKRDEKREDVAIVRVEQLYPLPQKQLEAIFNRYSNAEACWVQEEPMNMGAWQHIKTNYTEREFNLISRKASASPATGFKAVHDQQQKEIVDKAFN